MRHRQVKSLAHTRSHSWRVAEPDATQAVWSRSPACRYAHRCSLLDWNRELGLTGRGYPETPWSRHSGRDRESYTPARPAQAQGAGRVLPGRPPAQCAGRSGTWRGREEGSNEDTPAIHQTRGLCRTESSELLFFDPNCGSEPSNCRAITHLTASG